MCLYIPPTLLQLAMQGLLKNEALAISALDSMPIELLPPMFKGAFESRLTKILKAMVAAWPFPCLPVGALMKTPEVETLQAVLDGIDMLLTQKAHPRWKLQVLELRNVHQDFWDVWAGRDNRARSAETGSEKQIAKCLHRYALRWYLKVVTDLSLCFHLQEHQTCLLQWAQQRKGSVQLCCVKMQICDFPVETIICLMILLESLSITLSRFSQSDLQFLSQCPGLCQLKHLHLSHIELSTSHPTGLRVLLENVADTLQTLELEHCSLEDSHLSVLLPALSQCSQLTRVNFCDNPFSRPALKGLLQCMANLNQLAVELYPAPLECYDHLCNILVDRFVQLCPDLLDIVMAQRQPKKMAFVTAICLECCQRCVYDRKAILCRCWQ
nr:PRAME family member 20-like [Meriones unguiculatus]